MIGHPGEAPRIGRRRACRLLLGGTALSLVTACQALPPRPSPTPDNSLVQPRAAGADLVAVQASSELAVGRNRFVVGLIDGQNQPISQGAVHLDFFKVTGAAAQKKSGVDAVFRSVGHARGVWVSQAAFDEVGPWGAEVSLRSGDGGAPKVTRMNFEVQARFSAPDYGDAAPQSPSATPADVGGDVSHICTHVPPCGLHEVSLATALEAGQQPVVVAFATPAFCTSATCGPQLDAVLQLQQVYATRATFVHVEIYRYPFEQLQPAQAVEEWKLPSEPWTFVVDRGGVVRDRFEGIAPIDELEPALKAVLA